MRAIPERVVVVTGASSAIGRAVAEGFAREHAKVVLGARRGHALEQVARSCQLLGGEALVVPADVTEAAGVELLARQALEVFGRIDVWVNHAALAPTGDAEGKPVAEVRRALESHLAGFVDGARQALAAFRLQGAGVLVNIAPVPSRAARPHRGAHAAGRAATLELADCLRAELSLEAPHGIHVCTVLPSAIDEPVLAGASGSNGHAGRGDAAEDVARVVVGLASRPRRERVVARGGLPALLLGTLAPVLFARLDARRCDAGSSAPLAAAPAPARQGTAVERLPAVLGGWLRSLAGTPPALKSALLGLALGTPLLLWMNLQRRRGESLLLREPRQSALWPASVDEVWVARGAGGASDGNQPVGGVGRRPQRSRLVRSSLAARRSARQATPHL